MKLLFINAHPDDTEFTSASTCLQALKLGWEVHEILMTSDEYGTEQFDFKGKRIRKIRKDEMKKAAKYYEDKAKSNNKLNLYWFGEVDGHLPFNKNVFERLKEMIVTISPDIIIAPDSFYSMDLHPDHKHTGWLVYLIVKSMERWRRPWLLLYHSFNTNFYIPIQDIAIHIQAWSMHRSQTTPLVNKALKPLRKLFYIFRKRKNGPCIAEGFRKVNFKTDENTIKKITHRVLYSLFAHNMKGFEGHRYHPTPKELGIGDES